MNHKKRSTIAVRRDSAKSLRVIFPEDISKDFDMVAHDKTIPTEYLTAALARSAVSRMQLAEGCSNKCNKDCFW